MVPMATNGNRRLPSDTIGRYHILPMVTDGRTPNAPKEVLFSSQENAILSFDVNAPQLASCVALCVNKSSRHFTRTKMYQMFTLDYCFEAGISHINERADP